MSFRIKKRSRNFDIYIEVYCGGRNATATENGQEQKRRPAYLPHHASRGRSFGGPPPAAHRSLRCLDRLRGAQPQPVRREAQPQTARREPRPALRPANVPGGRQRRGRHDGWRCQSTLVRWAFGDAHLPWVEALVTALTGHDTIRQLSHALGIFEKFHF